VGSEITSLALAIFAFTSLLGWSYYCERAWQFLLGVKVIIPFRIVWSLAPIIGATVKLSFIWLLADVLNALMAIPNLIALTLLSPIVFGAAREFFRTRGKSEHNPF
jgi:alanine or glycine:cation symporter, AGCS family